MADPNPPVSGEPLWVHGPPPHDSVEGPRLVGEAPLAVPVAGPARPPAAATHTSNGGTTGQPNASAEAPPSVSPPQAQDASGPAATSTDGAPPADAEDASPLIDLGPVLRESPPWLISAVVHMTLLIIFGLLISTSAVEPRLLLNATYAEDLGEQLIEENLDLSAESEFELDEQLITPDELPQMADPLATPLITETSPNPSMATSTFDPVAIGLALTGREPGMKQALLKAYGGTALTEDAVNAGLEWLVRQQGRDGMWSLVGPYRDGAGTENKEAATAMALLAFQGAGHTHQGDSQNPYTPVVRRAWKALLAQQDSDGNFFQGGPHHHTLYTQALCTIALCELFGMTGDEDYRDPAQRAIDYCVKIQAPQGGWRYNPGQDSDLSVTGWFVMALQSARMAGLEVPSDVFTRVSEFLDSVAREDGRKYAYQQRDGFKLSLTAEGLLCRQYLGWKHSDPRLRDGAYYLIDNLPEWRSGKRNVYYWYYATQVCHHMEGEWWREWNQVMRQLLPEQQEKRVRERGSWDPNGDRWGSQGGRLYVTCLSIYILEVYYRHLPIYQRGLLEEGW